ATQSNTVSVSSEGERAVVEDTPYAADEFSRANKGTNRTVDKVYRGYNYIQPHENMTVLIDVGSFVMIYVPQSQTEALDLSLDNEQDCQVIKDLLYALDNNAAGGNAKIDPDTPWYFTQEEIHTQNDVVFSFNQPVDDRFYTFVIGNDGTDLSENTSSDEIYLNHASFAQLTSSETTTITEAATGLGALAEFFQSLDFSPLWVTLKTTLTAIVIIFILGIIAAWWSLRLPDRWQNVVDAIFTIPMVLPPTVCGFLLLLALGSNSPVGQWFNAIGFPLIFSWPATVIAAVVVAFPLMYRSARGAFESLNPDMLDAARTLGWNETRIFFKLMLPLAWSS
ncbi:MAG: ABC transporter permease subunit, partial [Eggerthellaceae bacterium]|nr:ABC transporter permease subunit [Eggerthellaceae bacterium]